MYSIKFFLRNRTSKSETTLNIFVSHNGDRVKLSTGIRLHPELWDVKSQKITSNSKILARHSSKDPGLSKRLIAIRSKLNDIQGIVDDYVLQVTLKKSDFCLLELKENLKLSFVQVNRSQNQV